MGLRARPTIRRPGSLPATLNARDLSSSSRRAGVAIAIAGAIGLGRPDVMGESGVLLGVLLASFVIGDVVGRNPVPPAVPRP